MSQQENPDNSALAARSDKLKADAALGYVESAVSGIERQVTQLRRAVDNLRGKQYPAADKAAALADNLAERATQTAALAKAQFAAYRDGLTEQAEGLAALFSDEAAFATAAAAIEAQIKQAQTSLDRFTTPLNQGFSALDRHLSLALLGAEAWAEFSGQAEAGEFPLLAADAEWVAGTGKDQAPDGVLYLTDGRLIFEQKEKVGKTLGLFGGRKVQEVRWTLPLAQIEGVTAKNAGMFGGKDMLFIRHGGLEYTVEVKGRASNDDWAQYIERAKAGQYAVSIDIPEQPDAAAHEETLARLASEKADRATRRQEYALNALRAAFQASKTPTASTPEEQPAPPAKGAVSGSSNARPAPTAPPKGSLGGGNKSDS